jgi:hypothetical protein
MAVLSVPARVAYPDGGPVTNASSASLRFGPAGDSDRDGGPTDDRLGDAAEKHTGEAVAAVAPDDDVVDVVLLGVLDDLLGRAPDRGFGPYVPAGGLGRLGRRLKDGSGTLLGRREPLVADAGTPGGGAVDRIHHVKGDDLGVVEQLEGTIEGGLGRGRAVDGNEYAHTLGLDGAIHKISHDGAGEADRPDRRVVSSLSLRDRLQQFDERVGRRIQQVGAEFGVALAGVADGPAVGK